MKRLYKHTLILPLFIVSIGLKAVPAKPGLVLMHQPDGTELMVRIVGDEHSHYYLSEDGYPLVNENETFYYSDVDDNGQLIRSDIIARPANLRQPQEIAWLAKIDMAKAKERLSARATKMRSRRTQRRNVGLFDTGFPSKGTQKAIVVLVEYQDTKFTLDDPYDYFNRMINENGFSDYGGTGCAAEYFRESSKNQFCPEFDVFGPITLSKNMSYYGGNTWSGDDQNPEQMVIEACQQLDATVDFSEYDRDGDGYIDNVFVFYAGRGEASGGASNTVWPHSWNITGATDTPYYFDGVRLDRYACSNEWEGSGPDGVGTFIHEFSHVLGLPDLYATSYTSAFTPGSWSVLDYGPYNNDGRTPPLYSIYERYSLGWIEPTELNGPANISMPSICSNKGCIIPTGNDNEFFLLENRQQTGWDKYIPGHGMLVWHVDFDDYVWENNTVNNSASHQYVDLEEADGTQNEYSRDGDAFPGTAGITSFTDDTRPSMRTWSGKRLDLPITDITETGGIVTFKVAGGVVLPAPVTATEATDIHSEGFTAHWTPSQQEVSYELSVYTKNETSSGKVIYSYAQGYSHKDVGTATSAEVANLDPETEYFYVIYANNGSGISEASNEISVVTGHATFKHRIPVALDATEVTGTSFTANWMLLENAESYELNVYSKEEGEPYQAVADFTGGVKNMPEGWSSNSNLTYANTAYSGEAIPSLRLATDDKSLTSPTFTDDVKSLSFWHRGVNSTEDNRLIVSVRGVSEDWMVLEEVNVSNEAGGVVTTIDDIPEGIRKIRISYQRTGSGSVAIDDVRIMWGGEVTIVPFEKFNAGNSTNMPVSGLSPETTYYYTVVASDGTLFSKESNEIAVTTSTNTAIDAVKATSSIRIEGRRLIIPSGFSATVSHVSGCIVRHIPPSETDREIILPAGVYIINSDDYRGKIIVR